jgi:hypothetical protein
MSSDGALRVDALPANRRGELSPDQQRTYTAQARFNRRNGLGIAALFLAGAVLIGFFASDRAPHVSRYAITAVCLGIAAVLSARSILGIDALTRDLQRGVVASAEGPIGKRRRSGSTGSRVSSFYYLDVGERTFTVSRSWYDAAPDAGHVRLYYLPHSRRIVNLERLAATQPAADVSLPHLVETGRTALRGSTRTARNEARADLATLANALKAAVEAPVTDRPAGAQDPDALQQAILGRWHNLLMTLTFTAEGTMTLRMPGSQQTGRWSIDSDGRLRAEIAGVHGAVDATIAGAELTIVLDGRAMRFTRQV